MAVAVAAAAAAAAAAAGDFRVEDPRHGLTIPGAETGEGATHQRG